MSYVINFKNELCQSLAGFYWIYFHVYKFSDVISDIFFSSNNMQTYFLHCKLEKHIKQYYDNGIDSFKSLNISRQPTLLRTSHDDISFDKYSIS